MRNNCPRGFVMSSNGVCQQVNTIPRRNPSSKGIGYSPKQKHGNPINMGCVALCNSAYGNIHDGECTSGVYSGITQCPCSCCDAYYSSNNNTTWTPWSEFGGWSDGMNQMDTQCMCTSCYVEYNNCINSCINNQNINADKDIGMGTGRP